MRLATNRTEWVQGALVAGVTFASLGVLGLVGAYWTWHWFAPRPVARLQSQAEPGMQIASALALFGTAPREAIVPVTTGTALRLLGVVAATEGRDAYAIVVLDGKQIIATRKGEEIAPGVKLTEVAPDHVVLERNGANESLAWPEKASPPGDAAAQRGVR